MKIVVCIKQVPDAKEVRLDPETNTTFIDSVIVALSDKDLPKVCAKLSEIEVLSV